MSPIDPVAFGRLEGKVDAILGYLTPRLEAHEVRIASLERWRAWAIGAAGAVGAVAGFLSSFWKGF